METRAHGLSVSFKASPIFPLRACPVDKYKGLEEAPVNSCPVEEVQRLKQTNVPFMNCYFGVLFLLPDIGPDGVLESGSSNLQTVIY